MKKILEVSVPKDVNLFETIVEYMQEYSSWLFISKTLSERLKEEYYHYECEFPLPNGVLYHIRGGKKNLRMHVDSQFIWDRVTTVSGYLKESSEHEDAPHIEDNPDYIIFLSSAV